MVVCGLSVLPGSCVPSAHTPYMVGCLLGAILVEDMRKSEQGAGFQPQWQIVPLNMLLTLLWGAVLVTEPEASYMQGICSTLYHTPVLLLTSSGTKGFLGSSPAPC